MLQSSQQISVGFWIAGAPDSLVPLFWWPTTQGTVGKDKGTYRGIATFVPYSGGSVYWAAGTINGAYDQVGYTIPQQNTGWQFWVFTKNAGPGGSMQVYENGVQLSLVTNTQGKVPGVYWMKPPPIRLRCWTMKETGRSASRTLPQPSEVPVVSDIGPASSTSFASGVGS